MTEKIYTTADLCEMTGVDPQTLNYWDRTKLLQPSVRKAEGRGTRRLYSIDDLLQLHFILHLKKHKYSVQKIRKALISLRRFLDTSEQAVLIDGKGSILALYRNKSGQPILVDTSNPGGQQVLTIVLETLIEQTLNVAQQFANKVETHA